jgi:hypothetical protein
MRRTGFATSDDTISPQLLRLLARRFFAPI